MPSGTAYRLPEPILPLESTRYTWVWESETTLVRYLAAIGHRKFCYIGRKEPLPGSQWGHDTRAAGYRNTIVDLNLTNCGMHDIDLADPLSIKQTVATILSLPERPTALCVWPDHYALPVIHELRSNGVSVPGTTDRMWPPASN